MAYKALYRAYRPQTFLEVCGQSHITKTLRNALLNEKLAHAYLFSGPRGTGKTSVAKIVAKAINCVNAPTSEPCNECPNCVGITSGQITDVIEIDAASNNGVDEIREIRDKVKYLPGVVKYKVYIIDEVHMLSTGAFNALLKTLEEPPAHVIFILATTEPHKIPATIHSRCQRFDFRYISIADLIKGIMNVVDEEKIRIKREAVKEIAESAGGGMRDALTLLDQALSFSNDTITVEDIHAIRGTVGNNEMIQIITLVCNNDVVNAMEVLNKLFDSGKEAQRVVVNLITFLRDLLIYKSNQGAYRENLLNNDSDFIELSKKCSKSKIFFFIDILTKTQSDMKYTTFPNLYLEVALVKMLDKGEQTNSLQNEKIMELEDKTEKLETKLNSLMLKKENIDLNSITVEPHKKIDANIYPKQTIKEEPTSTKPIYEDNVNRKEEESENTILHRRNEEESITQHIDSNQSTETEVPAFTKTKPVVDTTEDTHAVEDMVINEDLVNERFNIKFIEETLNSGDRSFKEKMLLEWDIIHKKTKSSYSHYVKILTSGELKATNGKKLIITFSKPTICNTIMKDNIKSEVETALSIYFNRTIEIMTIPDSVWNTVSSEFLQKWKNGERSNIKLSPINCPELKYLLTAKDKGIQLGSKTTNDAIAIFGQDIVKTKK